MTDLIVLHPIAAGKTLADKHLARAFMYYSHATKGNELEKMAMNAIQYAHRAIFLFEEAQRLSDAGKPHSIEAVRAATMLDSAEQTLAQAFVVFSNEG